MRLKCRFWDSKKLRHIYIDLKNKADWRNWRVEFLFQNYEIEWFTEFHDKKTKEIYAGDIVKFHYGTGVIVWHRESASFRIEKIDKEEKKIYYLVESLVMKQIDILGNIRQNPDLLTTKDKI